jgi:hypothetical protein
MLAKCLCGARLVCPHQPRVAGHIGGEDRGETAFDRLVHVSPGSAIIAGPQRKHREMSDGPAQLDDPATMSPSPIAA